MPYLVGERGPEIFVPSGAGRVETNAAYCRLASLGSGDNGIRVPSATDLASTGGVGWANMKTVRGGDVHVALTIQGGGDNASLAREAERAVKRVLAQYESDQRGLLSD